MCLGQYRSLKGFVVAKVEKTAIFAAGEEASAGISGITAIKQIFLIKLQFHDLIFLLQAVEFARAASHRHHYLSVVVAELCAEDEPVGGLYP